MSDTATARVGLLGGLGAESTIDYYRRVLAVWQETRPESFPEITIDSLDVNRGIELVRNDRKALAEYLLGSIGRLSRAGCTFVAMAANTPHVVFDDLVARSPVPLLSIVETCAEEGQRLAVRRLGLLGTGFTMESSMYPDVFRRFRMDVFTPDTPGRAWLHERYLGELLKGVFRDDTRDGVRRLVDEMVARDRIDAVVLAGTELPLLIRAETISGLPMLDTTELHVRAIVRRLQAAR
jgi:aspartate racemase